MSNSLLVLVGLWTLMMGARTTTATPSIRGRSVLKLVEGSCESECENAYLAAGRKFFSCIRRQIPDGYTKADEALCDGLLTREMEAARTSASCTATASPGTTLTGTTESIEDSSMAQVVWKCVSEDLIFFDCDVRIRELVCPESQFPFHDSVGVINPIISASTAGMSECCDPAQKPTSCMYEGQEAQCCPTGRWTCPVDYHGTTYGCGKWVVFGKPKGIVCSTV